MKWERCTHHRSSSLPLVAVWKKIEEEGGGRGKKREEEVQRRKGKGGKGREKGEKACFKSVLTAYPKTDKEAELCTTL